MKSVLSVTCVLLMTASCGNVAASSASLKNSGVEATDTASTVPSHSESGLRLDGVTLEEALKSVAQIFAGKTLVSASGTTKYFSPVVKVDGKYLNEVLITRAGGSTMVVKSMLFEQAGRVVIQEIPGNATYWLGFKKTSGNYIAIPTDPQSTFISQECLLRDGLTVCRQSYINSDGHLEQAMLREKVGEPSAL